MLEQRKSRRFDLRLPLELLRSGSVEMLESGETKNMSSTGVLFLSSARVEPGDLLEYLITLPSPIEGTELCLRCKGRVIRREEQETAATLERYEFVRKQQDPETFLPSD